MITYRKWEEVPENLKTKTQWCREKMKPIDESRPDAYIKKYFYNKWREFALYDRKNCVPVRAVNRKIREIPMTVENIAEALYIINKSAKKSRDTKTENYKFGRYAVVNQSKTRQNHLYMLKDEVIDILEREGLAKVRGYHVQTFDYDKECYLKMYEIAGFTFHQPIDFIESSKLQYLGAINEKISAQGVKTTLKFNESINLLERFLNEHGKSWKKEIERERLERCDW